MNYKRHRNGNFGCEPIFKRENSACRLIEIHMLRLVGGDSFTYDEKNKEYALIILG